MFRKDNGDTSSLNNEWIKSLNIEISKLKEENKRLREALEVIANVRNSLMNESMYVDACIERAKLALDDTK